MNPFTSIDGAAWLDVKPQLLAMIMGMVGLTSNDGISSLGTHIADTLELAWQTHQTALNFTYLMNDWLTHPDPRMHELALRLKPFTQTGDYARWFEAPCSINLDNPFVVLELEHLKADPRLMAVIVMMIITQVTNLMYRSQHRGERIMCVMDEAWALFKDNSFSEFINEGYRRARKYNGSFVSGTQSLMDFQKTPATQALIKNADHLIYLGSDLDDIDSAVKHDLMGAPSPFARHFIKAPITKKGKSSKCFIQSKQGQELLGKLYLDPFSKALYSTDAQVFGRIRQGVSQGASWEQAVMDAVALVETAQ